jgi:four helix bundle protein
MGLQNFEDLIVWQKSMDLVEEVYRIAKLLPKDEMYGLSGQMKRAVVSIPSNIAEGQERSTSKDFVKFLYIAKVSKGELLTLLSLAGQYMSRIICFYCRCVLNPSAKRTTATNH